MNLIPKLKKKPAGEIGAAVAEATPTNLLGDLMPLAKVINPMRSRMAEYDHAIHALSVARERLRDLADAPPPDMTLTVQREIAVAMGDPEVLARFDAANGQAINAEREARAAAVRDREELPARILALEHVVRQIAKRMRAGESVFDIERGAMGVFAPYAQRLVEAAKHYADVMQEAVTAAQTLSDTVRVYEYDLYADLKRIHRPELMGEVDEGILPKTMASVSWEVIQQINRRVGQVNVDLARRMDQEVQSADLHGEAIRIYSPGADDDHRKISSPELTRRVKRPLPVLNAAATTVVIGT